MYVRTVSRSIAAPVTAVWDVLADPQTWPTWGPVIADIDCADRTVKSGTRGEILVIPGVWLPFTVTGVTSRPERSWNWRVAGGPEISHRVSADPTRRSHSIVSIDAPFWLPTHPVVSRRALSQLAAVLGA